MHYRVIIGVAGDTLTPVGNSEYSPVSKTISHRQHHQVDVYVVGDAIVLLCVLTINRDQIIRLVLQLCSLSTLDKYMRL